MRSSSDQPDRTVRRVAGYLLAASALFAAVYLTIGTRETPEVAGAFYDVEFRQRVSLASVGVDVETDFEGVVEVLETPDGARYRIVSVRKLAVAANGERQPTPDLSGAAVTAREAGREHLVHVEGPQEAVVEVVRQLAFQAEIGACDDTTLETPLGRSQVRFDTCSGASISRKTVALESLRGIGELQSAAGSVRGWAKAEHSAEGLEREGRESFVGQTARGIDVELEVAWRWSPTPPPKKIARLSSKRTLPVPLDEAHISPKARERSLARARERATGGITLAEIETYLDGVTGAPASSVDHALFGRAASYFRLHPEDLPALVERLATERRRPSRLRTLDLFAAVGTPEAQLAFWEAVEAHVSDLELPEAMLRAGLFQEPTDQTVERLEKVALGAASHAWQRGTLALGAAAGFRRDGRGEAAVALLEQQLRARQSRLEKSAVVVALGNAGRESSLELIAEVAQDPSPQLRVRAAEALRKLEVPRAQVILTDLLHDEEENVVAAAMKTLRRYEALIPSARDAVLDQAESGRVADFALTHAVDLVERHGGLRRPRALTALLHHPHLGADLRARIRRQLELP